MIVKVVGAFIAIAGFAIMLETPKRYVGYAGIVGAIGWLMYLVCLEGDIGEVMATFLSAAAVSVVSHIFARIFKVPVTVFLVAGILPTVPGVGMYRIAYSVISGNSEMTAYYLMSTLELAAAIAIGIFVVDAFFKLFHKDFKQNSMTYNKNE